MVKEYDMFMNKCVKNVQYQAVLSFALVNLSNNISTFFLALLFLFAMDYILYMGQMYVRIFFFNDSVVIGNESKAEWCITPCHFFILYMLVIVLNINI